MADKQGEGVVRPKATEDDDVEGHRHILPREGVVRPKATEEDDVEGHRHILPREGVVRPKAIEPEGHIARKATEDDDVEGHSMLLNPLVARELAQARERDVQNSVKRHGFENDARAAKKDRR